MILECQEAVVSLLFAVLNSLFAKHPVNSGQAEQIGEFSATVVDGVEEAEDLFGRGPVKPDDERFLQRLRIELHKVEHDCDLHVVVSTVVHCHQELVLAAILDAASCDLEKDVSIIWISIKLMMI